MHYILKAIEKRKVKPCDDFFTDLVQARFDGDALREDEIISLVITILTAGLETTKNALGSLLLSLCEQVDARKYLIANPKAIPAFVEESLRYNAPLQYVGRTTPLKLMLLFMGTLYKQKTRYFCSSVQQIMMMLNFLTLNNL